MRNITHMDMDILIKNNKIMRTVYFLLLLSVPVVTNAQEFDKFKKLDTIYIKFKKKKTENRINIFFIGNIFKKGL